MPLLLAVSKSRVPGGTFKYTMSLPVSYVRYWNERGFEIKRMEYTEQEDGVIVLKPVLTIITNSPVAYTVPAPTT